ncbi:hypothetical protein TanjilG_21460 [Lupinus angustifolius]|uniref:Uncharacterized protein n=1 Tax=Lupinus angustifolius TaxID=3871 RepID=A0A4P1RN95_LUPAN|nr:PREDICTED: protein SKIP34 [Lupinus angustifolius]OIW14320.1 hypothetical protein TanjilG_21460 [Lupinus angustifolius]
MCCGQHSSLSNNNVTASLTNRSFSVVDQLRHRLAETEARLARARAREAQLSRRLHAMKRSVSVMEILEDYLKRRFIEKKYTSLASSITLT